jgi:hypothetical protein
MYSDIPAAEYGRHRTRSDMSSGHKNRGGLYSDGVLREEDHEEDILQHGGSSGSDDVGDHHHHQDGVGDEDDDDEEEDFDFDDPRIANLPRILMMGPRRAGKTSIQVRTRRRRYLCVRVCDGMFLVYRL